MHSDLIGTPMAEPSWSNVCWNNAIVELTMGGIVQPSGWRVVSSAGVSSKQNFRNESVAHFGTRVRPAHKLFESFSLPAFLLVS